MSIDLAQMTQKQKEEHLKYYKKLIGGNDTKENRIKILQEFLQIKEKQYKNLARKTSCIDGKGEWACRCLHEEKLLIEIMIYEEELK